MADLRRFSGWQRRMPAEWEPHTSTWVAWPHNLETWPGCMEAAENEFCALVHALVASEPVHILVKDAEHAGHVRERLSHNGKLDTIQLHEVATDDAWLRDTGPTFVQDRERGLVAIDWTFNTWGGKYPPWEQDDAVGARVAELANTPCIRPELVLEGGALEVDGQGTLLATESTLLNPNRNPSMTRARMEQQLRELIGVRHVVWLQGGIDGDDTDGHIDDIARFLGLGRVVCVRESNFKDPNHARLEENRDRLQSARDAEGRPLELIDLPMPPPIDAQGERLPASYANFYVANGALIVPVFGVQTDEDALRILEKVFPDRVLRPVPCRTLVRGLGAVHCLTQQLPQGPPGDVVAIPD